MAEEELAEVVCTRVCAYHRPGKDEPDRCGGFERLRGLEAEGLLGQGLGAALADCPAGRLAHDRLLARTVCPSCAFRIADCDFRDPDGPPDAPPCGGLRALDRLLELGLLAPGALSARPRRRRT